MRPSVIRAGLNWPAKLTRAKLFISTAARNKIIKYLAPRVIRALKATVEINDNSTMEKTTEVEIIIFHVPLYNYSRLSEYNLSPMNGALISNKWRLVRYEEKTPICRPSTFQYSASFATGLAPIGERATLCRERFVSIPQDHHRPLPPPFSFAFCFHPRAGYISSTCPPRYVQPRHDSPAESILRVGDRHATNAMVVVAQGSNGDFRGFPTATPSQFPKFLRKESSRSIRPAIISMISCWLRLFG